MCRVTILSCGGDLNFIVSSQEIWGEREKRILKKVSSPIGSLVMVLVDIAHQRSLKPGGMVRKGKDSIAKRTRSVPHL
jgi:hypothetical protein